MDKKQLKAQFKKELTKETDKVFNGVVTEFKKKLRVKYNEEVDKMTDNLFDDFISGLKKEYYQ